MVPSAPITRHVLAALAVLASTASAGSAPETSTVMASTAEASYFADTDAAMKRMMAAMAVKPGGDVDRDFVAMMAAHHQGAIDMAIAVLRYGRDPQVKRLAQEIVVTQQEEIAAMQLAIGQPLPPSAPSPTQPGLAPRAALP